MGSRNFPYRIRSGPITFSDLCFLATTLTDVYPAVEPHKSNEATCPLSVSASQSVGRLLSTISKKEDKC